MLCIFLLRIYNYGYLWFRLLLATTGQNDMMLSGTWILVTLLEVDSGEILKYCKGFYPSFIQVQ